VTLGDGVFRKSPMKMIYRKFPKTASLSVTCDRLRTEGTYCLNGMVRLGLVMLAATRHSRPPAVHTTSPRHQ
jgi:hypothetical protein